METIEVTIVKTRSGSFRARSKDKVFFGAGRTIEEAKAELYKKSSPC